MLCVQTSELRVLETVSRSKWDHKKAIGAFSLTSEHLVPRRVPHDKIYREANIPLSPKKELHACSAMSR